MKAKINAARMVILSSADGEEPWEPVLVNEVPKWLKYDPDAMAELHGGHMVQYQSKDAPDSPWYRAEEVSLH